MKFIVRNKNTGGIISPRNYYFVIKQNGELFTFNGSGKFEKADDDLEYELTEQSKEDEAALGISDVMPRYFFTRFHKGGKYSGWQAGLFGFSIGVRKWPNSINYSIRKSKNSRELIIFNRGFQFIWPLNEA